MTSTANITPVKYKRVLIVGAGAIAVNFHLARVRSILNAETIDIVDVNEVRIKDLQDRFAGDTEIRLLTKLPESESYDLAIIATPPKFHLSYYLQLWERVDLFLIEKPAELDLSRSEELANHSAKHDTRIMVHMIRRTLGSFSLIREFYLRKVFGELIGATLAEGGIFNWGVESIGSFSRDLNGGGVLMDTGPHVLDLMCQIFDTLEVESSYMDAQEEGVEANAILMMKGDNSVPVKLTVSRNRNLSCTCEFKFDNAVCVVGVRDNSIQVKHKDGYRYQIMPENESIPNPSFAQMIDMFYEKLVMKNNLSGVGITEACRVQRLIDTAYHKAESIRGGF